MVKLQKHSIFIFIIIYMIYIYMIIIYIYFEWTIQSECLQKKLSNTALWKLLNNLKKKEIYTFICKDILYKLIKWQYRHLLLLQNVYISNKLCYFELSINQSIVKKCIIGSTKILGSTTVFKIYNKHKCYLCTNPVKTGIMAGKKNKIRFAITGINYNFKKKLSNNAAAFT